MDTNMSDEMIFHLPAKTMIFVRSLPSCEMMFLQIYSESHQLIELRNENERAVV
jgi:hypothetical protein